MSITRRRAGRKSWETRKRFDADAQSFFVALSSKKWKFDNETTRAMIIERFSHDKREVITFNQAYGELSGWLDKSFANISDGGFSDMLAETFFQRAAIFTGKAEYRLWSA